MANDLLLQGSPLLDAGASGRERTSWRTRLRWAAALLASRASSDAVARTTGLLLDANSARTVIVTELPFRVRCVEGCVWVTLPPDLRDHVLEPGDEFVASAPGDLMMYAFQQTRVVLAHAGGTGGLVVV